MVYVILCGSYNLFCFYLMEKKIGKLIIVIIIYKMIICLWKVDWLLWREREKNLGFRLELNFWFLEYLVEVLFIEFW